VEGAWETLDFIDLPKDLASRLTDDDLAAILICICIDAKNELKHLLLTNCFSIVGHGVEPMRGSKVLITMDLGIVRHIEYMKSFTTAKLDRDVIIRLLRIGILRGYEQLIQSS